MSYRAYGAYVFWLNYEIFLADTWEMAEVLTDNWEYRPLYLTNIHPDYTGLLFMVSTCS